MKYTLEKHKFFPIIAWIVIIGFVIFTYSLALELMDTSNSLSERQESTVSALKETQ